MTKAKEISSFVAYYRVSTERQGVSGLGLEAQRKAVMDYLNGGNWKLEGEFTEIESGNRKNRPELTKALALCKTTGSKLVIAKLDRLARNVHFVSGLMESRVEFLAVDNPHANKLMVHMMAAFAEHEREQISERTKAGLERAKARGVKLGSYGKTIAQANRLEAAQRAEAMAPLLAEIRAAGLTTVRAICDELNRRQIPTPRGGIWHLPTVHTLLQRLKPVRKTRKTARKPSAPAP
jgi:DNA invertase Pin-like site-specific DNA recombinase